MISKDKIEIAMFYQEGVPPFVIGVNGMVDIDSMHLIEVEADYYVYENDKDDGTYFFDVEYIESQDSPDGRVEISAHWELTQTNFEPFPGPPAPTWRDYEDPLQYADDSIPF